MIPEKMPIIATVKSVIAVPECEYCTAYDKLELSYCHPDGQVYTYSATSDAGVYRAGEQIHASAMLSTHEKIIPTSLAPTGHMTSWDYLARVYKTKQLSN